MACGTPETADGYWQVKRAAAQAFSGEKSNVWEEIGVGIGLLVGLKEVLVNRSAPQKGLAASGGPVSLLLSPTRKHML